MKSYKDPSFQDRVGQAAAAKKDALDRLRTKPPVDEAAQAERRAARAAKEAALAEKRAAKKAAEEAEKAAQIAAEEAERAAQAEREAAARISMPTQAELKAARDARYAARKARK
jgi:hypothetical protein